MGRRRMSRGNRQSQTRHAQDSRLARPRLKRLRVEALEDRRLLSVVPAAEPIEWDFGDAPDVPYATLLSSDGPRHAATGPTLGTYRDTEPDGLPTAAADGDDTDISPNDEDGVTFNSTIMVGQLDAVATVNVQNAPTGAKLDAWIDFNGDGSWGGAGERIASGVEVIEGDNSVSFDVPSFAAAGETYARFRVSTAGNLPPTGAAADGEVEDHQITIMPPAPARGDFVSHGLLSGDYGTPAAVFPADLDNDGDMDLLFAYRFETIVWYENDGDQNFVPHTISTSIDGIHSVFAADVDGDGDLDVLSASSGDNKIAWYENDGEENFTAHAITTSANGARSVFAADVDGDGDMDILSASYHDDKIAWYENDGDESFTAHTITTSADGANSVLAADVDGDGDLDVLSASWMDSKIAWYENDGDENFTAHTIVTPRYGFTFVFAADIDGDGDMDMLSKSCSDDRLAWYENDGDQNFTAHAISTSVTNPQTVFVADMDGDGDMDMLSGSDTDNRLAWYENDGDQNFALHVITSFCNSVNSVFAADMDGDGDLDVVPAAPPYFKISWYENVKDDFGDAPAPYPTLLADQGARHTAIGPTLGAVRDLDSDGLPTEAADGDDLNLDDDEDGIVFESLLVPGHVIGLWVNVQNAPAGAKLDAWIDFNADGAWDGPDERIADSQSVAEGDNGIAFAVPIGAVGGITYARFRLSTAGGLAPSGPADDGEVEDYRIEITPVVELGPVDFVDLPGLDPAADDIWYRFETTRAGFVTVDATYDPAGGSVELELFDGFGSSIAVSAVGDGYDGIDHTALGAGEVYLVKLSGNNSDVELRICNLVSQDGYVVDVNGTTWSDVFQFDAHTQPESVVGAIHYLVAVNGVEYEFTVPSLLPEEDFSVTFHGEPGDWAELIGSAGDDTAHLHPSGGSLAGGGYLVTVLDTPTITVHGDGGLDTASFYDSPGDDTYTAWPKYVTMTGPGYAHETLGFYYNHGYARTPGEDHDVAILHDSPGNDTFKLDWPRSGHTDRQFVKMYRFGYYNRAKMFESSEAYLSGGDDLVRLFDSAGDDVLEAQHGLARMYGADYHVSVSGAFQNLFAYASEGRDQAFLLDSIANDVIRARHNKSVMWSGAYTDPDYKITERRFDEVYAWAGAIVGYDKAKLHMWSPDDVIVEGDDWMRIEYAGVDRFVEVAAFEWYRVYDPSGQIWEGTPVSDSGTSSGTSSGTGSGTSSGTSSGTGSGTSSESDITTGGFMVTIDILRFDAIMQEAGFEGPQTQHSEFKIYEAVDLLMAEEASEE
jgi:VCBS repeat protein/GEVED domain-containing protein